jgi:sterol 24-C-methyltransferase
MLRSHKQQVMASVIDNGDANLQQVWRYYNSTGSRLGYAYILHGTKHLGWYKPGQPMRQFTKSMRQMEDQLGERLSLPPGREVLDAGCGMGDVARTMATKYKLMVTGIDILDFNIDEARKRSAKQRLGRRTRFQLGDYHKLDFPDESFDGVYTMETLVHASDPGKVLSEFLRVLRPGGRLVMFEYSRAPEAQLSPAANEALRRVCDLGAMPAFFNLKHGDLVKLIADKGFKDISEENVTERILPMVHAFSLLGRFPYFVGRLTNHVLVNAMSGVEMYRHRHDDFGRYNIYLAQKPSQ